jgi:hypothetical protein
MDKLLKAFILSFILCGPTIAANAPQQQIHVPTVQQQMEIREATECEQKVRHYRELKETKPNAYVHFMFNLWYKRCPDK